MDSSERERGPMQRPEIVAVDLFCGVGGMTCGLQQAELRVVTGIDIDETCRYPYEHNNGSRFLCQDVRTLEAAELKALYPLPSIRVLVGCPPCQPFSNHTQKNKSRETDAKWSLLSAFRDAVEGSKPHIVVLENVPQLKGTSVYREFYKRLSSLNYELSEHLVSCHIYSVAQRRKRLVLLASRLGAIELLPPGPDCKGDLTVADVIGDMSALSAGETGKDDSLHRSAGLSELNLRRIRASKPGGTWRDWPEDLRAPCHRRASGKSWSPVYGRMKWDDVAPTITTEFYLYGAGRFGHPSQDRALSLREGALLQGFPDDYAFVDPEASVTFARVGMHIGNAIPVPLAKAIGRSIVEHVEGLDEGAGDPWASCSSSGRQRRGDVGVAARSRNADTIYVQLDINTDLLRSCDQ